MEFKKQFECFKFLQLKRSSSTEEQVSLADLPAALDSTLMVPGSGLQHAAATSYGYKLQCLWIQVRQIARERDKARLDLEKAERRCLHLGKELDEQYMALKHTQSKLRDFQAEIEAKKLLLQQAVSHQAKLEADTQFLEGKEAGLQGRLNHVMKENTQLQNKVTEMAEKLSASEQLVLELQTELNHIVKDKLDQVEPHSPEFLKQSECFAEIVLEYERQCQALYDENGVLRMELQRLRLQLQESRVETGLPGRGPLIPAHTEMSLPVEQLQEQLQDLKVQLETKINYYEQELELMRKNFERERKDNEESFKAEMHKMEDQKRDLEETVAKHWAVINSLKEQKCMWNLELEERSEMTQARVRQHHTEDICHPGQQLDQKGEELTMQQHRDRLSLRKHVGKLGREKMEEMAEIAELTALLLEAKASLSLVQTQHALQLQHAKAQMNNMVPKKQFEQLQTTLMEEQCKTQQLQESLHQQAKQTCRQLGRTQKEHEHLLQAAVEQAEGLEHSLRNAEAVLAERAAQLRDAQAHLSRNKLLIEDLRGQNRRFAMALQASELKQKSIEEKNQLLEDQASALKQLIGKITPASLIG
ncbi:ninein-like protein [Willisornis vidua]|uniref:Ninein-like protein n=1 Tax=Willisornis vidua TaxID=1566151 RepID=A0ABQ9DLH7_9PASS|nr:ninein-like protein [Willisornis vidua]